MPARKPGGGKAPSQRPRNAPSRLSSAEKTIAMSIPGQQKTGKAVQKAVNNMFNSPTLPDGRPNPNYRPIAENSGGGTTPFSFGGKHVGAFDGGTGRFEIAGKTYKKPVKDAVIAKRRTAFISHLASMGNPKAQALMAGGYAGDSSGKETSTPPVTDGAFASGVSASTLEFVKEAAGASKFASGEAEGGATKDNTKKGKKGRKKLVKRASKQTGASKKKIRKAINTKGTSPAEKKLYAKAKPRTTARLRMADRRTNRGKK